MPVTRHRRQVLLFLIAILLPACVLIGLGGRTIIQEREVAIKRAADRRQDALEHLRRELFARVETIKLQEITRLIRSPASEWPQRPANAAVILVARVDGDRLALSWEPAAQADAPAETEFARHRQEGETLESVKKDHGAAAAAYRQALASAGTAPERADARLLLARALAKSGNAEQASRTYAALLKESSDARDEQGVGYRFYAAERLVQARRETDAVARFLDREVSNESWLTLPELYLIRSLLESFPQPQTAPPAQERFPPHRAHGASRGAGQGLPARAGADRVRGRDADLGSLRGRSLAGQHPSLVINLKPESSAGS
jgi:tetratricopeptide (TPR) repeat protein